MLSITDLQDFIDLDMDTIHVVTKAARLPVADAITLACQLLSSQQGISILHHMFRDQIADAAARCEPIRQKELRRAYTYFSRKYPLPQMPAESADSSA